MMNPRRFVPVVGLAVVVVAFLWFAPHLITEPPERPTISLQDAIRYNNTKEIARHMYWRTNIEARDIYNCTPLEIAVIVDNVDAVRLLIEQGANVNTKGGGNEDSPLHMAAGRGHVEVVKLLVENGADLSATNNVGWAPASGAQIAGHTEVVDLLIELAEQQGL